MNIEEIRKEHEECETAHSSGHSIFPPYSQVAHRGRGELLKIVDSLMNGKALNSLHNQIVKLEVENVELKEANNELRARIESLTDQLDSYNWQQQMENLR